MGAGFSTVNNFFKYKKSIKQRTMVETSQELSDRVLGEPRETSVGFSDSHLVYGPKKLIESKKKMIELGKKIKQFSVQQTTTIGSGRPSNKPQRSQSRNTSKIGHTLQKTNLMTKNLNGGFRMKMRGYGSVDSSPKLNLNPKIDQDFERCVYQKKGEISINVSPENSGYSNILPKNDSKAATMGSGFVWKKNSSLLKNGQIMKKRRKRSLTSKVRRFVGMVRGCLDVSDFDDERTDTRDEEVRFERRVKGWVMHEKGFFWAKREWSPIDKRKSHFLEFEKDDGFSLEE